MKATKKCKNCNFCKRVYRRGLYRFWKDSFYYCLCRESLTERENGCEWWKRKITEYDLSEQRFIDAEKDIRYLSEQAEK